MVYRLSVHGQCRGKNDQGRAMAAALCRLVYHDLRSIRGTNVNKRAMSPPLQFSLVERLSVSGRLSVIFQRARFVRDVFVGLQWDSDWRWKGQEVGAKYLGGRSVCFHYGLCIDRQRQARIRVT